MIPATISTMLRTTSPVMGFEGEVGVIVPGKLADIVIWNSDPLADITALQRPSEISTIIKDGRVVLRGAASPNHCKSRVARSVSLCAAGSRWRGWACISLGHLGKSYNEAARSRCDQLAHLFFSSRPSGPPAFLPGRAPSGDQIEPACRQLHLAAALARNHRHHLLGENLHLLLDFFGLEAAEFEPTEKAEIVVAALVAHLHDRVDDTLLHGSAARAKSAPGIDFSCKANVFRSPKLQHAVQTRDSNGHLGRLPPLGPGAQRVTDHALGAAAPRTDRGVGQHPLAAVFREQRQGTRTLAADSRVGGHCLAACFSTSHSPGPQSLRPVLSTSRWTGSLPDRGCDTGNVSPRRLMVEWSGAARSRPSSRSACRSLV